MNPKDSAVPTTVQVTKSAPSRRRARLLHLDMMPQAMIAEKTNALLVLPQGPYRARDSFGGKMEDTGGFKRMVDDVLATLVKEEVIKSAKLNKLILSAHSGGYRPAAFVLDRGRIVLSGMAAEVASSAVMQESYLGAKRKDAVP